MTELSRRNFFKKSAQAGMACCALLATSKLEAFGSFSHLLGDDKIPDPKLLNYCGYTCPEDCPFRKASIENDVELKKECYENWDIQRHGIEFEADKIFCYGCKNTEQPEGVVLKNCTVRSCAIDKGYDCCIECNELVTCDKELWGKFPDFHKQVVELQKTYLEAKK